MEETKTDKQRRYIRDQLIAATPSMTDVEWAAMNGMDDRTLRRWKLTDSFKALKEEESLKIDFSPDTRSQIIANMLTTAKTDRTAVGVSAAKLALDMMEKFMPTPKLAEPPREFADMTLRELWSVVTSLDPTVSFTDDRELGDATESGEEE